MGVILFLCFLTNKDQQYFLKLTIKYNNGVKERKFA